MQMAKSQNVIFDPEKHIDAYLPVRVNEQRVSNLLQSLLVAVSEINYGKESCISSSPLAGDLRSLQGFMHLSWNQYHSDASLSSVFQFVYLLMVFGVTWIPIAGILFPLPFFLPISIRQHLLPKLFHPRHLQELDAAEYEEIAGAPQRALSFSFRESEVIIPGTEEGKIEICDAEILDELTTSRGELKVRTVSFSDNKRPQVHPTAVTESE
ncbi:hypothetical protein K7X08_034368 [Anisodus acutangulus]|uniref:Uncharacterized protein n=1 Tax=Anisodus acutangulus TaxID=402998 RepID=A0A9Q1R2Y1_9SOLA|nr:hypothetical protein K7X08_034368 [Anisodus acutangulus]